MEGNLLKDRILGQKDIEELIPHRGWWQKLDKIVEVREKSIIAIKIYTVEECDGHFLGNPVVPGVLVLESLAQAGLALVSYHQKALGKDRLPVLGHIIDGKFYSLVRPGDKLVLEMELANSKEEACLLKGRALVDSRRVAKCELMGVYIDKPK